MQLLFGTCFHTIPSHVAFVVFIFICCFLFIAG
jgi:hypothetical protein